MPKGRRKARVVLSDDEAEPPIPQQLDEPSDMDSDPDVPLARKRPRLDDDATPVGERIKNHNTKPMTHLMDCLCAPGILVQFLVKAVQQR
jgi:hypothetical protein